ncbi:MAG TPA: helix-hairpin-helix domain-containing protein, partial [Candidatus Hydrogenedentes bacterium]|nr:helix-hairpin-helix domain-containing protein [Candidatus Hydrogenedentota bacterium]
IDGGRGQLAVARAVLDDLGLHGLPCASIAKSRPEDGARSPERFFLPNRANPVVPPQSGPVVRTLARLRDEAHRIAITHHRARRKKEALAGELLRVPGVGPKRMRALLAALGSLSGVRAASPEQLAAVPGFNEKLARQVWEWLQQTGVGGAPPVGAAEKGETS